MSVRRASNRTGLSAFLLGGGCFFEIPSGFRSFLVSYFGDFFLATLYINLKCFLYLLCIDFVFWGGGAKLRRGWGGRLNRANRLFFSKCSCFFHVGGLTFTILYELIDGAKCSLGTRVHVEISIFPVAIFLLFSYFVVIYL